MNSDLSGDAATADRGALGLIGMMLATATLLVTVTAAVAVNDYRGGEVLASLPATTMTAAR
ncbi:MAG: hypothetical protein ACREDY_12785 [Bradyrhizobium sp.]